MANGPFDQRIINQLERPTSSDLNIAQGQLLQNVPQFLEFLVGTVGWDAHFFSIAGKGALNRSFLVSLSSDPNYLDMEWGIGLAQGFQSAVNVGGINGLNIASDVNFVYSRPRVVNFNNRIEITPSPPPGYCRKDLILIRPPSGPNGLGDAGPTDIYEPTVDAFVTQERYKTYFRDISTAPVAYINSGDPIPDSPVTYVDGALVPYVNDESLNYAAPLIAGNHINVAVINRRPETFPVPSDVLDVRRIIAPNATINIQGSATIGANSIGTPGAVLSDVAIAQPSGIKTALTRLAGGFNQYAVCVCGARSIVDASISFSVQQPLSGIGGGGVNLPRIYGTSVSVNSKDLNTRLNAALAAQLGNSVFSAPTIQVGVGQLAHVFTFSLDSFVYNSAVSANAIFTDSARSAFYETSSGFVRSLPITFTITLRLE